MISRRHLLFNFAIILFPWVSLSFIGKRSRRHYTLSSVVIVILEILNHLYGHKRKWWKFYDKRKSFIRDELPFSVGLYLPLSMWMLKLSYGNFKRYVLLNTIADGLFAFLFMDILKRLRIIRLNRLNHYQFFLYIHFKAYLLYGAQYLLEKMKGYSEFPRQ